MSDHFFVKLCRYEMVQTHRIGLGSIEMRTIENRVEQTDWTRNILLHRKWNGQN